MGLERNSCLYMGASVITIELGKGREGEVTALKLALARTPCGSCSHAQWATKIEEVYCGGYGRIVRAGQCETDLTLGSQLGYLNDGVPTPVPIPVHV